MVLKYIHNLFFVSPPQEMEPNCSVTDSKKTWCLISKRIECSWSNNTGNLRSGRKWQRNFLGSCCPEPLALGDVSHWVSVSEKSMECDEQNSEMVPELPTSKWSHPHPRDGPLHWVWAGQRNTFGYFSHDKCNMEKVKR